MYDSDTCASEDMDPPVLGSRILTRLIILYVMGFNNADLGAVAPACHSACWNGPPDGGATAPKSAGQKVCFFAIHG